jgi:hypothetical protein
MLLNTAIDRRPFAVEPITQLMMPDGIFDISLQDQLISCFIVNKEPTSLTNVEIYFESAGDIGIVVTPVTHRFATIPQHASVLVQWPAKFERATPGKKLIAIRAVADGKQVNRMVSKIFVSKTEYNALSHTFLCHVPEGTLELTLRSVAGPRYRDEQEPRIGPWLFTEFDCVLHLPGGGYKGLRGDLPFHDPWWKLIALLVAFLAGLASAATALKRKGSVGVSCTLTDVSNPLETCHPDIKTGKKDKSILVGGLSLLAAGALKAALADEEDVWYRGQGATNPAADETTKSELLSVRLAYDNGHPPIAGQPFPVNVSWQYTRVTDKRRVDHAVTETVMNTSTIGGVQLETPKVVKIGTDRFIVKAQCQRNNGKPYVGSELYMLCVVEAPDDMTFNFPLMDHGIAPDSTANDGWYTGKLPFGAAIEAIRAAKDNPEGLWKVYLLVQDAGIAPLGIPELQAAKQIGGFLLHSPFTISLKPGTCGRTPAAVVQVVK